MTVAVSGESITFNDNSVQATAPKVGMVNRLINGSMTIDQRNAGAASAVPVSVGSGYTLDRWRYAAGALAKFTLQQNQGGVTLPVGFSSYLGVTSSAATSLAAGDFYVLQQPIEGFNTADLSWGTASAAAVTLSFRVYSSLTGTFGGALGNDGNTRSYPFTYSVPTANTWTTVSVTVPGDTTGTWLKTNGIGISVYFGLGVGTTYLGTSGAWAGAAYLSAIGAVNVAGTSGATFYITGVQLEKGSTATSFDYRPYGTELGLCQRYYYRLQAGVAGQIFGSGYVATTSTALISTQFPTQMRTSPSALDQSGTANNYRVNNLGIATACSSVPVFNNASTNFAFTTFTTPATLTAGNGAAGSCDVTAAYLGWSAEL